MAESSEQEKKVAEELGVKPVEVELPSAPVRGIMLFEMENGELGVLPMGGMREITLEEASGMAQRLITRAQAERTADRVMEKLAAKADEIRQATAAEATKPKLVLARSKVRTNQ